jgi:hypothetical protein
MDKSVYAGTGVGKEAYQARRDNKIPPVLRLLKARIPPIREMTAEESKSMSVVHVKALPLIIIAPLPDVSCHIANTPWISETDVAPRDKAKTIQRIFHSSI